MGHSPGTSSTERLLSLDQFRGYTVVGMLLVNYFGHFAVCPRVLRHTNDYNSYADTIMPHFLFAVGFAMRLSLGRRLLQSGNSAVYLRMVRRLLGLMLVSLLVYSVGQRAEHRRDLAVDFARCPRETLDTHRLDDRLSRCTRRSLPLVQFPLGQLAPQCD